MPVYRYDPPQRFIAGTVGEPGERTFFLQAVDSDRITSVALEKAQVSALAERVEELLEEVRERFGSDLEADPDTDDGPLQQPLDEDFRVGRMALAWDPETDQVIIEAQEAGEEPEASEDDSAVFAEDASREVLRVHLTPGAALAFAKRAQRVVAAGRPNCPLCGQALDPGGHVCPRKNGYKRVTL